MIAKESLQLVKRSRPALRHSALAPHRCRPACCRGEILLTTNANPTTILAWALPFRSTWRARWSTRCSSSATSAAALGFTTTISRRPAPATLAGAVVRAVAPRSAAERAGLKPGDLVTELGAPVRNAADPRVRLALLRIGEVTEFAVSRLGGTLTVRAPGLLTQ
jgi:hypothetical protein